MRCIAIPMPKLIAEATFETAIGDTGNETSNQISTSESNCATKIWSNITETNQRNQMNQRWIEMISSQIWRAQQLLSNNGCSHRQSNECVHSSILQPYSINKPNIQQPIHTLEIESAVHPRHPSIIVPIHTSEIPQKELTSDTIKTIGSNQKQATANHHNCCRMKETQKVWELNKKLEQSSKLRTNKVGEQEIRNSYKIKIL